MIPRLYPAIDLLEGRAVRLLRGERKHYKIYSEDPAAQARQFVEQGASELHLVDLDAAFGGKRQAKLIERIVASVAPALVQVGGGIRTLQAAEETLHAGAGRIILGTAAVEKPALAGDAVEKFGVDRVACGLDIKEGRAATRGWTEARGPAARELAAELAAQGVRWMVVTAVSRDGTLEGFDLALLRAVTQAAPGAHLIASGGAGDLSHLRVLAAAGLHTFAGAIAGTALYEGRFTIREGQAVLEGPC
ncbi:MAG: 1-(5-phosphoribosyl)-5-[(5-phosphoribosylamino)methylideneamino] imidazole-4-carboxamide isomerase [Deltaproteobacteria bacterium]|nr:MAG: 1-(5-phosphoribosyl)-5-[(5-phosphoribosylamino)methylideneamino] imidazole-4-carboxamide isomerase [Deltaproteobacteria bacterium]